MGFTTGLKRRGIMAGLWRLSEMIGGGGGIEGGREGLAENSGGSAARVRLINRRRGFDCCQTETTLRWLLEQQQQIQWAHHPARTQLDLLPFNKAPCSTSFLNHRPNSSTQVLPQVSYFNPHSILSHSTSTTATVPPFLVRLDRRTRNLIRPRTNFIPRISVPLFVLLLLLMPCSSPATPRSPRATQTPAQGSGMKWCELGELRTRSSIISSYLVDRPCTLSRKMAIPR